MSSWKKCGMSVSKVRRVSSKKSACAGARKASIATAMEHPRLKSRDLLLCAMPISSLITVGGRGVADDAHDHQEPKKANEDRDYRSWGHGYLAGSVDAYRMWMGTSISIAGRGGGGGAT